MSRTHRAVAMVTVSALLILVAAACGDDDYGDDGGGSGPAPAETAATRNDAGGSNTITVTAERFAFDKTDLDARKGESVTVVLVNNDQVPHTLTVYNGEDDAAPLTGADTGRVSGGTSGQFSATFPNAGEYYFRCEVHPASMKGEIAVE